MFDIQYFDTSDRALLMDIVEDRNVKHITLVASQVSLKNRYDVIGELTFTDGILV